MSSYPTMQAVNNWYETPLGRKIFVLEQQHLNQLLTNIFGYYAVCLDNQANFDLSASPILHKINIAPYNDEGPHLPMALDALAFAADSVDLFILPHTLEWLPNPDQILAEVHRCLIPEGKLIIVGYNPHSFFGLWQSLQREKPIYPWNNRFLSTHQLSKWIGKHHMQVESVNAFYFRPPIHKTDVLKKLRFMELLGSLFWPYFGSVYTIVACKHVAGMTPIKPQLKNAELIKNYAPTCSRTSL